MPFDGNGIYELPVTTVTPAVAGTTIDDAEFNTFTADLATALTLCLTKDGQTSSPTLTTPSIVSPTISGSPVFTGNVIIDKAEPRLILTPTDETLQNTLIEFWDELSNGRAFIYRPTNQDRLRLDARNAAGVAQAALEITEAGGVDVATGTFSATSAALTSPIINTGVSGTAGVRGIFILDNPETLYSSATYTSGAWTSSSGFASTTLSSAGATGAIVRLFVRMHWLTDTDVQGLCAIRKAGEIDTGVPTYINMQRANLNSNGLNQISPSGEGTVALDASSDFEFSFSWDTAVAPTIDQNFTVTLIGYYV